MPRHTEFPDTGDQAPAGDELKEDLTGYTDKASNEAQQMRGKAKEWVGDKTDDEQLQAEGTRDRLAGNAKQAGEHVKDAARDAGDALRGH